MGYKAPLSVINLVFQINQPTWSRWKIVLLYDRCRHTHVLTYWGRVTHICVSRLTIIGSVNGLSPDWRWAIIWTRAEILLIGPLGTGFTEIAIAINTFSFNKMHLKMSPGKRRPFCLGLNVLITPVKYINVCIGINECFVFKSQICHDQRKQRTETQYSRAKENTVCAV